MATTKNRKTKGSQDFVQQALLLGLGVADLTHEKLSKAIVQFKKNHPLSRTEGRKAVRNAQQEFDKTLRRHVKKIVDDLGLATKEDLRRLKRK